MITKISRRLLIGLSFIICQLSFSVALVSCSDDPDSDHFYTFTGEMMSDYLRNRPQYSEFATIVERAGLMDLLSSYGAYTCFAPSNDAVQEYLQARGLSSVDQLSTADCDTIARTHIVPNMYSTYEMSTYTEVGPNLDRDYVPITLGFDNDSNAVICLNNRGCHIDFVQKDDSVENGIMQPINQVLEPASGYLELLLKYNERTTVFFEALEATGVLADIENTEYNDPNYDPDDYEYYDYSSDGWQERGYVPETKKKGFTLFVETDEVYARYGIEKGNLRALYDLACKLYDPVYPDDVDKPGHSFDNLTDDVNPLRRFMQYHVLTRKAMGYDRLTPKWLKQGDYDGALGFDCKRMNPVDWFETLLPHTMIKIEQLTVETNPDYNIDYLQGAVKLDRYINRRVDNIYPVAEDWNKGQHILPDYVKEEQNALNGIFFYVDDIVSFNKDVQQKGQDMRIRMDFASIFPELMTNDIRQMGDWLHDQRERDTDPKPKYGKDYYFPDGYLEGLRLLNKNSVLVYRRPHTNFWSFEGDEMNIFGDYDVEIKLPPIPYSGEWQVRIGFCALNGRGIAQVYLDGVAQGIPIDMRMRLTFPQLLGICENFPTGETSMTSGGGDEGRNNEVYETLRKSQEDLAEDQKALRNLGVYRGPYASNHVDPNSGYAAPWVGNWRTYRRVVSQQRMDASKDHWLRFRVASESTTGERNLFMLDYLELVPKTVYGVDATGLAEGAY